MNNLTKSIALLSSAYLVAHSPLCEQSLVVAVIIGAILYVAVFSK